MERVDEKTKNNLGILAVCLVIFIIFSMALDPTQSRSDYAKCKSEAHKIYSSSLNHLPIGAELPPVIRQENQKKRSKANQQKLENFVLCSDLNAQWSMSFIGYWGLLAGIIGLLAIMATLWQTMRAAKAASDTLGVAQSTLNQAQNHSEIELRGYLGFNVVYLKKRGLIAMAFEYYFSNDGHTPIYDIQCRLTVSINERAREIMSIVADPSGENPELPISGATLNPKENVTIPYITDIPYLEVETADKVFFTADITYIDIFKMTRFVRETFSITGRDVRRVLPFDQQERRIDMNAVYMSTSENPNQNS